MDKETNKANEQMNERTNERATRKPFETHRTKQSPNKRQLQCQPPSDAAWYVFVIFLMPLVAANGTTRKVDEEAVEQRNKTNENKNRNDGFREQSRLFSDLDA